MNPNQTTFKTCSICNKLLPLSAFSINNATRDKHDSRCAKCVNARHTPRTNYITNKSCAAYLGVHVAERVLSKVFNNVKPMPTNNPGYDFICNHGKKIDVKAACLKKGTNSWGFDIKKNTTADYFLCIAFDNRHDLTPLYLWLIPGSMVNHLTSATISKSTIDKWNEFAIDISKTLQCCSKLSTLTN